MKNYFFIIILIVLFADTLFPHAIDIPISATDGNYTYNLNLGLDLTATDCIDPQLGESELPPIPPIGIFQIKFTLPSSCGPLMGVYRDYRAPGNPPAFPYTGIIQHRIEWQTSASGLPFDISFDLPQGVLMQIKDEFGGILLNLGPFTGQGTVTIPGSFPLNSAFLEIHYYGIGGQVIINPAVDVQLIATTGTFPPVELNVGLDLTATNCIDPQLGEYEIPILPPPPQLFDMFFQLNSDSCNGIFTYKDYRTPGDPPSFPFTGQIQHKLVWSPVAPEFPIDINYIIPAGAIMYITDENGSIYLNLGPFSGQGTATIPGNCLVYSAILKMIYYNIGITPAVNVPLNATDGSATVNLDVGLDLSATDCIDPQLGECEVTIIPPAGVFDARLQLESENCEGVMTYKDYRPPGDPPAFPFTGQIEHQLIWQKSEQGLPIDINYNIPPGAIMYITDLFGGIILNIGPLSGQGTATIPGSCPLTSALVKMTYNNIGGEPIQGSIFCILPESLNFGEVPFGQSRTLPVDVLNLGLEDSLLIYSTNSSNSAFCC